MRIEDNSSKKPQWRGWNFIRILGKSSYGEVYKAEKEIDGEKKYAAIRHFLFPVKGRQTMGQTRAYLDNALLREAKMSERQGHVTIEDYEILDREDALGFDVYIRMELLTNLPKYRKQHSFSIRKVIDFGIDILRKLEQEEPIYHAIKPNNIFSTKEGFYRLDVFDAARELRRFDRAKAVEDRDFMAPEVCYGQEATVRSDIYSLGMVMYWLLNGGCAPFFPPSSTPISTEMRMEALTRRVQNKDEFPPLPPFCPKKLKDIIRRACAYPPEERWSLPNEMIDALRMLKKTLKEAELNQTIFGAGAALSGSESGGLSSNIDHAPNADHTLGNAVDASNARLAKSQKKQNADSRERDGSSGKKTAVRAGRFLAVVAIAVGVFVVVAALSVFVNHSDPGEEPHTELTITEIPTVERSAIDTDDLGHNGTKPAEEPAFAQESSELASTPTQEEPEPVSAPTQEEPEPASATEEPEDPPAAVETSHQSTSTSDTQSKSSSNSGQSIEKTPPPPPPPPAVVEVTSVTLSSSAESMEVDRTLPLTATVLPDNATDKSIQWSSSDETKATVSGGRVHALESGTVFITATSSNGIKATCTISIF